MSYYFFVESYFHNHVSLILADIKTQQDALNLHDRLPHLYHQMEDLAMKVFGTQSLHDFLIFIYETINVFALRRSWESNRDIWILQCAYAEAIYWFLINLFNSAIPSDYPGIVKVFTDKYYDYMNILPEAGDDVKIIRGYAKYWRTYIYEEPED